MDHQLPNVSPSYRDVKQQNRIEGLAFTLVLSNRSLSRPLPIHCLFCGYMIFAANALPKATIEGRLEIEDTKRSIEVRCKKCKATCMIT